MPNRAKTQLDSAGDDQGLASRKCRLKEAMETEGRAFPTLVWFYTGDGLTSHGERKGHALSDWPGCYNAVVNRRGMWVVGVSVTLIIHVC